MIVELLRNRRSIRLFKDQPLSDEQLEMLTESLLRSPSSRGVNPWGFILVQDKDILSQLSQCKINGSTFLKGAALAIVIFANAKESDVWVEDCSIASVIVQLAAEDMGLGSCWVQIRNRMHNETRTSEEYVRNLLNIPDHLVIESIIGIGVPDEVKEGHEETTLQYDKIHMENM